MARRKSIEVSGVEKTIILINNWVLCRASTSNNLLGKSKELMSFRWLSTEDLRMIFLSREE